MLSPYSQDLIAISKQPQLLKEIFPDRLYINIQNPDDAEGLSNLAHELGLPTVITHPIYYLAPEQARLGKTLTTLPKDAAAPLDAYFPLPTKCRIAFGNTRKQSRPLVKLPNAVEHK